jgi:hypothetical protein
MKLSAPVHFYACHSASSSCALLSTCATSTLVPSSATESTQQSATRYHQAIAYLTNKQGLSGKAISFISRLLEKSSLPTTLQGVYFIFFASKNIKYKNKHLEKLLGRTVLLITLIKYAQQDAEPQNKN